MHRGTVLLEGGDVAAGSDHTEPDGVDKDGMKAGTVQSNHGRAHCLIQLGQVHFCSKLATARVEDRCAAHDSARLHHRLTEAELHERPYRSEEHTSELQS